MKKIIIFSLFSTILLFFSGTDYIVFASPGDLDQSFGSGGKVSTLFPAQTTTFRPRSGIAAIAIQPDGKIVAGGYAFISPNGVANAPAFALTRYNADGSLDSGFGSGGKLTTYFNGYEQINALAIQPDGKIVAAGFTDLGGNNFAFALARYNADGSLDASFDGDGKLVQDITSVYDMVNGVAIQPDGKIIAAGYANGGAGTDFATVRYNADGTIDANFGSGGMARTDFDGGIDGGSEVVLLANGKIVVAGTRFNGDGSGGDFALVGYNADGSLDSSFGGGGKVLTDFSNNSVDNASDMTLAPDGKIVVAGYSGPAGTYDFAVARYNQNGSLDTTFDGDGKFVVDLPGIGRIDGANGVAVQQNGKIVLVGRAMTSSSAPETTPFELAVARLNPNGGLDTSFGAGGKMFTDFNDRLPNSFNATNDEFGDVLIQPDGKIVVGGEIEDMTTITYAMALARYTGDPVSAPRRTFMDFDGDGKADLSVFRPANGYWYVSHSSNNALVARQFGANGDLIAPADFDGDGKTDIAVFRPADGGWYRLNSSNNTFTPAQFGTNGDLPAPGDFDGDGKADLTVFRPSAGSWYRINSSNNQLVAAQFGIAEDKPLVGDFDGDGKSDLAVFRPSNGTWYRINSSNDTFSPNQFGASGDLPVAADYDGDGKTDLAVYRPSVGDWYIVNSSNSAFISTHFGVTEDKPAPADFDGDGKADLIVFRPSTGTWYLMRTTAGFTGIQFGASGDIPAPNAFVR